MKIYNKSEWKKVKLRDVCNKVISGEWGTKINENSQNIASIIRTTNFSNDGKIDIQNKELLKREIDETKINEKRLKKGDIIIEKSGGSPNQPVGRVVYFNLNDDNDIFLCNNFTSILRVKEKINSKYIFYFLRNNYKNNKVLKYQNKTTGIINLKLQDYLKESYLFLPELKIQDRIVRILNNLEYLLEKNQKYLNFLTELTKSLFTRMFGDIKTNDKNWKIIKLDNIYYVRSSKRVFEKDYRKKGIPFFRSKEIVELCKSKNIIPEIYISLEKYEELKKITGVPLRGDLLITAVGTIGKIWKIDFEKDFYFKDGNLIWLQLKSKNYFNTLSLKKILENTIKNEKENLTSGSAYNALTIDKLKRLNIVLPPIELQNKFAERVEKIEKLSFIFYCIQYYSTFESLYKKVSA
ncbi:restriction endonuclease subunit S [Fusobacterium nucleatum]|uniref:restriction endonuclease subunit S n=1 Tax=Fusobacterium nucleatum TaxID=851 RepID=UPI0004060822|nr:restriction endonuclease subunit S [Fusobacterium nucleatum]